MKLLLRYIFFILLTFSLFAQIAFLNPSVSTAQTPGESGYKLLVDCSGPAVSPGSATKECNYRDAIAQVNKIINFLFYISVLLATIAFIYCGFLFLTAGGDTGKVGEAKTIFFKVVVGFIWIFAAWLIVNFITGALGLKENISLLE